MLRFQLITLFTDCWHLLVVSLKNRLKNFWQNWGAVGKRRNPKNVGLKWEHLRPQRTYHPVFVKRNLYYWIIQFLFILQIYGYYWPFRRHNIPSQLFTNQSIAFLQASSKIAQNKSKLDYLNGNLFLFHESIFWLFEVSLWLYLPVIENFKKSKPRRNLLSF